MDGGSLLDALLQPDAEGDPGFRERMHQQSAAGLRLLGLCFLALALFMGSMLMLLSVPAPLTARLLIIPIIAISAACIAFWRTAQVRRRARTMGIAVVAAFAALLLNISLIRTAVEQGSDRYIAAQTAIALMIGLIALPVRPLDALVLGLWCLVVYVVCAIAMAIPLNPVVFVSLLMMALLATGLAHVLYMRSWQIYRSYSQQLESSRELSRAEIRRFVAQSAATTSRMAAALSHELNTPVGALKSSIDTLTVLADRRHDATGDQLVRIESLESQVRRSARDAALRLQQVVQRMQRVTNLDRAEVQKTDVNALLKDVVYLLDSESRIREREVMLSLGDVPEVTCRPQQISAVFSNVLGSATEMPGGPIHLETRLRHGDVEIVVQGAGPRLSAAETQAIFDPAFAERSGRIQSANWSLFMARQVLRENGGEMRMERDSLVLSLPVTRGPS
jgi:signal transduction histidine kinase